jgi:hypothetical protein
LVRRAPTKNTTNIGKSGSQCQLNSPNLLSCASTMSPRSERAGAEQHGDDDKRRDLIGDHLRGGSQRNEEAYFEFDAQPAMIAP